MTAWRHVNPPPENGKHFAGTPLCGRAYGIAPAGIRICARPNPCFYLMHLSAINAKLNPTTNNLSNLRSSRVSVRRRKGVKANKAGPNARGIRKRRTEPLLEQPVADPTGAVPCQLCGHPVDPKRLHFHMVRYHGTAFSSKNG
jgi:hypothetical protein